MAFWTRRNWMTLAAIGGFVAVAVGAFAAHGVQDPKAQEWLRTGAMYGFMHTMATFACATFMNIGARDARHAPAFFLGGILLFSGPLYAVAGGMPAAVEMLEPVGIVALVAGWLILAWSARTIDFD